RLGGLRLGAIGLLVLARTAGCRARCSRGRGHGEPPWADRAASAVYRCWAAYPRQGRQRAARSEIRFECVSVFARCRGFVDFAAEVARVLAAGVSPMRSQAR